MNMNCAPRRQSGLTLIEVLVAMLIFSFGLLGFVGLQARAIQYSVSAEDSNRAALLANEIGTMMVEKNDVNLDHVDPQLIIDWKARVATATGDGLPNGQGEVSIDAGKVATITLTWRAPGAISGTANSVNKYVTQVILP